MQTSEHPLAPHFRLVRTLRARVSTIDAAYIGWAVFAASCGVITALNDWFHAMEGIGLAHYLYVAVYPTLVGTAVVGLWLRLSVDDLGELADRPSRFALHLLLAALAASGAIWGIDAVFGQGLYSTQNALRRSLGAPAAPLAASLLNALCDILLYGAVFGWAGALYYRKRAEQARLTALLIRQAQLGRRIAQSRLAAVRTRVDPEQVARVLARVRVDYAVDAPHASALLDQLIDYLRLAMGRREHPLGAFGAELDVSRAYLALLRMETGAAAELQAREGVAASDAATETALHLLRFARVFCEELAHRGGFRSSASVEDGANRLILILEPEPPRLLIRVPGPTLGADVERRLQQALSAISSNALALRASSPESGEQHYVVSPVRV